MTADNTVTFYAPATGERAWRAMQVAVELDGSAAPYLELIEVKRSASPGFNTARFRLHRHELGTTGRFEEVRRFTRAGRRISAWLCGKSDAVGQGELDWPLFVGVVCQAEGSLEQDDESVEIVACDELVWLNGAAVDGVRLIGVDGHPVYVEGTGAVFNPDGRANRSAERRQVDGRGYHVFELNASAGAYWTCASAIRYIAAEYLPGQAISQSSYAALESMTDGQVLSDVDATGLTPLAAIERLCDRAALGLGIVHVPIGERQVLETIQFYRRGGASRIYLRHQRAGESLDLGRTNVAKCYVKSTRGGESIMAIGTGATKRFEATFELVGAWDESLEQDDYDLYSPSTNEDFHVVRDVFRKFTLNEAGDYSGEPYNRGEAYDFGRVFGSDSYGRRRRRFWPCLSRTTTGESMGYHLEISYVGGGEWWYYSGTFSVLLDECGVYISCDQFDLDMWNAIRKDLLKFRITASVDADEPILAKIATGPIDSSRGVRTEWFEMGEDFQYRQRSAQSIFSGQSFIGQLGEPDTADDSEALRGALREQLRQLGRQDAAGSATLPWVQPDMWPGMLVGGIDGRGPDLAAMTGQQDAPQVSEVQIVLDDQWCTKITF